jgi:hypothetical protein
MSLFVCAKCECIENTALGHYWMKSRVEQFKWTPENEQFKGYPLCSECEPIYFIDGSKNGKGKWHGRFPKEHWSKYYTEKPKGTF